MRFVALTLLCLFAVASGSDEERKVYYTRNGVVSNLTTITTQRESVLKPNQRIMTIKTTTTRVEEISNDPNFQPPAGVQLSIDPAVHSNQFLKQEPAANVRSSIATSLLRAIKPSGSSGSSGSGAAPLPAALGIPSIEPKIRTTEDIHPQLQLLRAESLFQKPLPPVASMPRPADLTKDYVNFHPLVQQEILRERAFTIDQSSPAEQHRTMMLNALKKMREYDESLKARLPSAQAQEDDDEDTTPNSGSPMAAALVPQDMKELQEYERSLKARLPTVQERKDNEIYEYSKQVPLYDSSIAAMLMREAA